MVRVILVSCSLYICVKLNFKHCIIFQIKHWALQNSSISILYVKCILCVCVFYFLLTVKSF